MSAVLSDLLPREPDARAGSALMAGGALSALALLARLAESNRSLEQAFARMQALAACDALTDVYNRRFLMETMARVPGRADQALYRGKAAGRNRVV